ncbi:MAG: hypothetical protein IJR98_06290 [Synergistaceae bacterium]|nr:hypothetical protein [Synergistaceae bacterium]
MKKICVALMMLILTGTASFGAVSDDVYLRKDVFDAKMEAMFNMLRGDIQALSERMDGKFSALSERIDGLDKRIDALDKRIDGVDKRIDDLRNGLYLWLVALGLFISWPRAKETLQKLGKSTPSITLEDVKRLIEEHDAELRKSLQV